MIGATGERENNARVDALSTFLAAEFALPTMQELKVEVLSELFWLQTSPTGSTASLVTRPSPQLGPWLTRVWKSCKLIPEMQKTSLVFSKTWKSSL